MAEFTQEEKEFFMREALKEAQKSLEKEEIPIGCVIVKDGEIIGRGHNAREERQKAILHAEIMAIVWRLRRVFSRLNVQVSCKIFSVKTVKRKKQLSKLPKNSFSLHNLEIMI